MKILSFGHIPTWAGGKQESGLANVIYQLAKHGSEVEDVDYVLAATDCFVPERTDGRLTILGWTKPSLINYVISHPLGSFRNLMALQKLKKAYPIKERFWGLYLKRIFFEKSVKRIKPQIVHLHGTHAMWYVDMVPNQAQIAITFHGINGLDKNVSQHEVLFAMERDLFRSERVSGMFFICTKLVDDFKTAYGENCKKNSVIFNSYDSSKFFLDKRCCEDIRNEQKLTTLCTIASLSELKGQSRVLIGLNMLSEKKRFRYFCIGGDSLGIAKSLEAYAKEHSIDFDYLGKMKPEEIRHQLQSADYMIMPSSSEGFGLTYLEAIACGVPVILPRDIPIALEKELINKHNSILLDDCSAESITKVLQEINNYHFQKDEVAASIAGVSWDEVARQYVEAFKEL